MSGFDEMAKACQIFSKYSDSSFPFHCQRDKLIVCGVEPDEVTEEDKERLEELGFKVQERPSAFYSFRFGSC